MGERVFSSTIIPTVARKTLERAVNSVLDQEFDAEQYEIIVVNDSGQPLPRAPWQDSPRVRVIETNRRDRSVARNTGAAVARGRYLHFLDDDDWMAPGALQIFWDLSQSSQAGWLYGSSQLVDRSDTNIIRLDHRMQGNCFTQMMAGEWIPLQASFLSAQAFFETGGFSPLLTAVEDVDLARRMALHQDFRGVSDRVVYIEMGVQGSTSNYITSHEYGRWGRELILDQSGVFSRLLASAGSGSWRGRIPRLYFTSCIWNMRRQRFIRATSRALFGFASLAVSFRYLISPAFWKAFFTSYDSPTFLRGFDEANLPVERRKSGVGLNN